MHYKSICLELLKQRPTLHERLRRQRKLLTVLNSLARDLKSRHEAQQVRLSRSSARIDPSQIEAAALEIALREMEDRLRIAFPEGESESLSLDAGIAFIRNRTSHD